MFLGIDPGGTGAIALYVPPIKARKGAPAIPHIINAWDMPVNEITVSKTKRKRLDVIGLSDLLDEICMLQNPDKIIVEQVGGMPGQASGFAFGFGVGALHAVLIMKRFPFEVVTPGKWKKDVKAPKDKKEAAVRAEELFPDARPLWRPVGRGGKEVMRHDRAEAVLLAYWASTQA
jgi:hypothetical protein